MKKNAYVTQVGQRLLEGSQLYHSRLAELDRFDMLNLGMLHLAHVFNSFFMILHPLSKPLSMTISCADMTHLWQAWGGLQSQVL